MTPLPPIAYTIAQAIAVSGNGETKIYAALSSGALPGYKNGRRTLVLATDLEKWVTTLPRYRPNSAPEMRAAHAARQKKSAARRAAKVGKSTQSNQIEEDNFGSPEAG